MTIGEYAQMINGEKWTKNTNQCNLQLYPDQTTIKTWNITYL